MNVFNTTEIALKRVKVVNFMWYCGILPQKKKKLKKSKKPKQVDRIGWSLIWSHKDKMS